MIGSSTSSATVFVIVSSFNLATSVEASATVVVVDAIETFCSSSEFSPED